MRTIGRALVLVLLAVMLPALPARAQEATVQITGGGWGHGIGMSQYGAFGRAKRGDSAAQILEHYYSGAQVSEQKMPRRIRVGLLQYRKSISMSSSGSPGKVVFKVAGSSDQVATGGAEASWRVEPSQTGGVRLYKDGEQIKEGGSGVLGDAAHPLVMLYEPYGSTARIVEKARDYSLGRMEFGTYPSDRCDSFCLRLNVILAMQKYLYGLGEVPSSWPQEALRSQAIAGRTYAYEKVLRSGQHREPCDCAVYDSTVDQAYVGDEKRTGSGSYWDDWKSAVDATKKKVILYDGNPIQALYSSSSGGHTEHNENVWGGTPLPYLRGVRDNPDAVDENPNHTWSLEMSFKEFENKLNSAYHFGELEDFELVRPFGVSGRVTIPNGEKGGVRITGSNETVRESGWSIRSALSLKDSLFRVQINYPVAEKFESRYRKLDGAPGRAKGPAYAVPRKAKKTLGRAQNFRRGRMTWRRSTGKVVWQWGRVLRKYNKLGRERSELGMPTSDVWGPGFYLGGTYSRGIIISARQTGNHTIRGGFKNIFQRNGGPQGPLGLPKENRRRVKSWPKGGLRQRFTNGTIYLNPRTNRVFALWGAIDHRYRKMGAASSDCGYPVATLTSDKGVQKASFEDGMIRAGAGGRVRVSCKG
ncbi:MAG TPA: SpoIID/LytB domain-containing protein [Actinomycetota bacterium]|nr:SpoIID/LytB domain-containing protein [Actinomycetota bacterium]